MLMVLAAITLNIPKELLQKVGQSVVTNITKAGGHGSFKKA